MKVKKDNMHLLLKTLHDDLISIIYLKLLLRFRMSSNITCRKSVLFKKRSIIEYAGNRSNRIYYVVKGLLRSYHLG